MALLDSPDPLFNDDARYVTETRQYRLLSKEAKRLEAALAEITELTTICARCGYSVNSNLVEGREWFKQHRRECK